MWSESFLWASMFWGAIGSGYLIYGWKQRTLFPFIGGVLISAAACFIPALPMTLFCVIVIFAVWWLLKQGY